VFTALLLGAFGVAQVEPNALVACQLEQPFDLRMRPRVLDRFVDAG